MVISERSPCCVWISRLTTVRHCDFLRFHFPLLRACDHFGSCLEPPFPVHSNSAPVCRLLILWYQFPRVIEFEAWLPIWHVAVSPGHKKTIACETGVRSKAGARSVRFQPLWSSPSWPLQSFIFTHDQNYSWWVRMCVSCTWCELYSVSPLLCNGTVAPPRQQPLQYCLGSRLQEGNVKKVQRQKRVDGFKCKCELLRRTPVHICIFFSWDFVFNKTFFPDDFVQGAGNPLFSGLIVTFFFHCCKLQFFVTNCTIGVARVGQCIVFLWGK